MASSIVMAVVMVVVVVIVVGDDQAAFGASECFNTAHGASSAYITQSSPAQGAPCAKSIAVASVSLATSSSIAHGGANSAKAVVICASTTASSAAALPQSGCL